MADEQGAIPDTIGFYDFAADRLAGTGEEKPVAAMLICDQTGGKIITRWPVPWYDEQEANDLYGDTGGYRVVPLFATHKTADAGAMREAASYALMYLQTGFVECPQCGHEVPTADLDATYTLADVVKPAATDQSDAGEPL